MIIAFPPSCITCDLSLLTLFFFLHTYTYTYRAQRVCTHTPPHISRKKIVWCVVIKRWWLRPQRHNYWKNSSMVSLSACVHDVLWRSWCRASRKMSIFLYPSVTWMDGSPSVQSSLASYQWLDSPSSSSSPLSFPFRPKRQSGTPTSCSFHLFRQ